MSRLSLPANLPERLRVWAGTDAIAHGTYGVRVELVIGSRVRGRPPAWPWASGCWSWSPSRASSRCPRPMARSWSVSNVRVPVENVDWVTSQGSRREYLLHATVPLDCVGDGVHAIRLRLTAAGRPMTLQTWPSDGVLRAGRRRHRCRPMGPGSFGQGRRRARDPARRQGPLPHARWVARQLLADSAFAARPRPLRQVAIDIAREMGERGCWADRMLRLATMPIRRGGPIWLVGERTDTAQDNGRAFFQHVRTQHPDRRAYYVIKQGAKNARNVLPYGNVVWHDSLRHRILALHADALVGSHSIDRYLLPKAWAAKEYRAHLAWRIGSKRVYLKHGVLGVRTMAFELSKQGLDIVVATGKPEADFMRGILGYDRQLKMTGLPRYDLLVPRPPKRVIVMMPTWRKYIVPPRGTVDAPDTFTGSNYERFYREVLGDARLHAALERHDYTLEFYPHYNIDQYYRNTVWPHPRIRTSSFSDREVKDTLIECGLFITDFSSVVFDAAYLGRAVIHAPFDEADYLWGHYGQGWFDMDTMGFGPVARTADELVGTHRAISRRRLRP